MKIKITKGADGFVADPLEFPGSPPVGRGQTLGEALGDFLIFYRDRLGIEIEVDSSIDEPERQRMTDAMKVWDLY